MSKLNKTRVYEVYDEIINWFDDARTKNLMESEYLNLIVNAIPPKSSILDLGCGTGEPIAQFFIEKGFKVTGVDGSQKMIELCRKRFPDERWIVSDMRDINLQQQFDAILAWHSFFHLDHDSQRNMFKIFESHTKPGGVLAFTSGEEEAKSGVIMEANNFIMHLCRQKNMKAFSKIHHLKCWYIKSVILSVARLQFG